MNKNNLYLFLMVISIATIVSAIVIYDNHHDYEMKVLYGLRLVGHSDRQLELALAEQAHVDQVLLVLESEGC